MTTRFVSVRCRSCTPVPAIELTAWLEDRVAELREEAPELLVRLTRLVQDLRDATIDDGWLIEVELPGDHADDVPAAFLASLEEMLGEMRVLGLAPTVLAPVGQRAGELAFRRGAAQLRTRCTAASMPPTASAAPIAQAMRMSPFSDESS